MGATLEKPKRYKFQRRAYLDKPKTDKFQECGEGNGIRYGLASMQGWRVEMEDAHVAKINLGDTLKDWSYFAVFDGHAGAKVSMHCAEHLLDTIMATKEFQEDVMKAIHNGFLELDSKMRSLPEVSAGKDKSGTTALCAFVSPKTIYIANCGDSRAVLCSHGQSVFSTQDHKPELPTERDRICKAGGNVTIQRVNGSLAVSRALGDFKYKNVEWCGPCEQLVSPEPEIFVWERDDVGDEFLVLACDGVWDVMSNWELCAYIKNRMSVTDDLQEVTAQVIDTCFHKDSRDNMSIVLVVFPGAPKPTTEAILAEQRLDDAIEKRIFEILQQSNDNEFEQVLRKLSFSKIEGLPPAGLASKRTLIDKIYKRLYPEEAGTNSGSNPEYEIGSEKVVNTRSQSRARKGPLDNMERIEEVEKAKQTEVELDEFVNKRLKSPARKIPSNKMGPIEEDIKAKQTEVRLDEFADKRPKSSASMDSIEEDKNAKQTVVQLKEFVNTRSKSRARKGPLNIIDPIGEDEAKQTEVEQKDFVNKRPKSPAKKRPLNNTDLIEEDKKAKQKEVELEEFVNKRPKSGARKGSLNNMDAIEEDEEDNQTEVEEEEFVNTSSESRTRKGLLNIMSLVEEHEKAKQIEVEPKESANKSLKLPTRNRSLNKTDLSEDDIKAKQTEIELQEFVNKRPKSRAKKRPLSNMDPTEEDEKVEETKVESKEFVNKKPTSPARNRPLNNADSIDENRKAKQLEAEMEEFVNTRSKSRARNKLLNDMDPIVEDKKAKQTEVELEKFSNERLARKSPLNNMDLFEEDKHAYKTEVQSDQLVDEDPKSPAREIPLNNMDPIEEYKKAKQIQSELKELVNERSKSSASNSPLNKIYPIEEVKNPNQTEIEPDELVSEGSKSSAGEIPLNNIYPIGEYERTKQREVELEGFVSTRSKSRSIMGPLNDMDPDKKSKETDAELDEFVNKRPQSSARKSLLNNIDSIDEDKNANQTEVEPDELVNEGPTVPARERSLNNTHLIDEYKKPKQTEVEREEFANTRSKSRARNRPLSNIYTTREYKNAKQTDEKLQEFVNNRLKSQVPKRPLNNVDSMKEDKKIRQAEVELDEYVNTRSKSRARKRRMNNMDQIEDKKAKKMAEVCCEASATGDASVSPLIIGVIGIGNIGRSIVGKLIQSGHTVNIWNRTTEKSDALEKYLDYNNRLTVHNTPQSLLIHSEKIFICISDESELRLFFQDNFNMHGTEEKTLQDKGIIIMTSMSPETAKDMKDMIEKKGGRYLETLVQWSSIDNGQFILLAAGDETLFQSIQSCTKAISNSAVFLGDAGYACCVYLILQFIKGVCLAGLSEGIHLAERCGVKVADFYDLFNSSQLCNNYLKDKMTKISNKKFELHDQRMEDLQRDMKLGLDLSNGLDAANKVRQPLYIGAVAHELFKHCCKLEYGGLDAAAVYFRNKH